MTTGAVVSLTDGGVVPAPPAPSRTDDKGIGRTLLEDDRRGQMRRFGHASARSGRRNVPDDRSVVPGTVVVVASTCSGRSVEIEGMAHMPSVATAWAFLARAKRRAESHTPDNPDWDAPHLTESLEGTGRFTPA